MHRPTRTPNRLAAFDYSTPGAYFITICAKDRRCIFGKIAGGGTLNAPNVQLSHYGKIVRR